MAPPPAAAMAGIAALVHRKVPVTLMSNRFVNSSSDSSVIGLAISMSALLTRPSRPPNSATAAGMAASTSKVDRTSQRTAMAPLPSSAAAARAPSTSTSAIATRAPPAVIGVQLPARCRARHR